MERFSDPSKGLSPVDVPYPTAMLEAMGGYDVETGGGIWDPLRLAAAPEADLKWYRQARSPYVFALSLFINASEDTHRFIYR